MHRAVLRWATHPVLLAILLGLAVAAVAPAQESSIIVPSVTNPTPAVVSPAPADPALPATSTDSSILEPTPAGEPMRIVQPGLAPSTPTPVEAGGNAAPQPASANPDGHGHDGHNHEAPLEPIQMVNPNDPVEVEPASFKGVTPGATTAAQLREAWGNPIRSTSQDGMVRHLYAIEPFEHIEVTFSGDKVASVVIRLNHAYPSTGVAKQLDLVNVRPVLVADELGNVLGQAYPERGVLFSFTAEANLEGKDRNVNQIVLEPLSADTFVLRAETYLDSRCERSLADLNQALKMNPSHARAYWLRSRVLSVLGKADESLVSSSKAVQLESANPRYRLTYARALERAGRIDEAVSEVRGAVATSDKRIHVKARALCMLGDLLVAGSKPDYRQAMSYHMEAIQLAKPFVEDRHPAIRTAAKEVLVDAHLAAAHNIAWGYWKDKDAAVTEWLRRAALNAEDLIANESGSPEYRFRVTIRALSTYVGMQGKIDPENWIDAALASGRELIDGAEDPTFKEQVQWDLGMAMYDALQIYQMRGEHDNALKYGELAIQEMELGGRQKRQTPAYAYLMGRLYFRLGAIHAVRDRDHGAAITWFDKAVPLLSQPIPPELAADLGRHGETFVSMGVSYWEVNQQQKAVEMTERGVELMEQAVRANHIKPDALAIPYGNLATMHRELGQDEKAQKFAEMASKNGNTLQR